MKSQFILLVLALILIISALINIAEADDFCSDVPEDDCYKAGCFPWKNGCRSFQ